MKKLNVFAYDKAASIILQDSDQKYQIEEVSENSLAYVFDDNPEVRKALQNFFDDIPLPCKSFSNLCKSLRQQLMAIKNQKLMDEDRDDRRKTNG